MKIHFLLLLLIIRITIVKGVDVSAITLTKTSHDYPVKDLKTCIHVVQAIAIPSRLKDYYNPRFTNHNYINLYGIDAIQSDLSHTIPKKKRQSSWTDTIHEFLIGGLFGRYVLVLIGSFVLCVMSKSFMPLFYSLYIICNGIVSLHDTGYNNSNLMEVFPFFKFDWSFLLFIGHIFYFFSIRFFIGTGNIPEKKDKYFFKPFMVAITALNLTAILFYFTYIQIYHIIFPIILFTDALLGLLLIYTLFNTGDKGIKLILSGMLIMICSGIIRLIMDLFQLLPHFYLYSSGIIAETALFILAYNHRKSQHELSLALVKNELNHKQRAITQKTMYISQQSEFMDKIKSKLRAMEGESSQNKQLISSIISDITLYSNQHSWDEFERYFTEVHPDFFKHLKQQYPNLTSNEVRLCAMLRLALSTKEIAAISGKTPKSIDVMRNRIRNKLGLDRQDRLYNTLSSM